MKYLIWLISLCFFIPDSLSANNTDEKDSLLEELDKAIAERQLYSNLKQQKIDSLNKSKIHKVLDIYYIREHDGKSLCKATFKCCLVFANTFRIKILDKSVNFSHKIYQYFP